MKITISWEFETNIFLLNSYCIYIKMVIRVILSNTQSRIVFNTSPNVCISHVMRILTHFMQQKFGAQRQMNFFKVSQESKTS